MEVLFNPELQAQLDELAAQVGRPTDELVREVITGYVQEVAQAHKTIDRRYDEIQSGQVQLIRGEEIEAHFAAKRTARSSRH